MKKAGREKKGSVFRSIAAVFAAAIAVSCLISAFVGSVSGAAEIRNNAHEHSAEAAQIISDVINGRGGIETVFESNTTNAVPIRKTLEFLARGYDLEYLYLFTLDEENDEYHYIIAVSCDDEQNAFLSENRSLGTVVPVDDIPKCVVEASHGSEDADIIHDNNEFGNVIGWAYPLDMEYEGRRVLIGAEYLVSVINEDILERVLILVVPMTVVLIGAGAVMLFLTHRKIIVPVAEISEHMRKFTENYGGKKEKIDITDNNEIGEIASSFNKMSDDIHTLIADNTALNEVKLQAQIQLDIARRIQSGIVPENLSVIKPDHSVCAFARAARSVGGDFYDSFMIDDTHICIVIGDVSGKGITAALFMTMTKTIIREMLKLGITPDEALNRANDEMCQSNPEGLFATVFAAVLDLETGVLQYANAGHNPPLLLKEKPEFMKTEIGIALGVFEDAGIVCEFASLNGGEGILLYTDGVTEAVDKSESFYGTERLLKACENCRTADETVAKVSSSVLDFYGGSPQFDDLTMIALFRSGSAGKKLELLPQPDEFDRIKEAVTEIIGNTPLCKKIILACDEVFANIYSYSGAKKALVSLDNGECFSVTFEDDGIPFDPLAPREEKDFDDLDTGGMGIGIVKQTASSLTYKRENGMNILTLSFNKQ